MMPVMAYNLLQSIELLARAARVFADRCASGLEANVERCEGLVEQSLAMCTSLAPIIGYDKAAEIAKKAHHERTSLKEAALKLGYLTEKEFDQIIRPEKMTRP